MKNNYSLNFIKAIVPIFLFSFFIIAEAQTNSVLFIKISPEIPGAYEEVTASVSSPSVNLDIASISWSLDGKKFSSNVGQKSITFKTKGVGEKTTVVATATLGNTFLSDTATINPSEVDILWEATDIYTPPFYKGKALPTSESSIKVTIVPSVFKSNGVAYKTSELSYKWSRNGEILGSLSGRGASTLSLKNDYLKREESIGVETRNTSDVKIGKGGVIIRIVDPKILFYEKNPILGVLYNKSLFNSINLSNEELSLVAEPYFISPRDKTSSKIQYTWSLNGSPVATNSKNPNILVVRQQTGVGGEANVSLEVTSPSKILLSATNNLMLNFKGR